MMVTLLTAESIESFQESLYARGRSSETVRHYCGALRGLMNWSQQSSASPVSFEGLAALYLNQTRQQVSPKTTLLRLASFRQFATWAGHPSILTDYKAPKPTRGKPHPLVEGVEGIRRMIAVAPTKEKVALVAFIGLMGMRVSEARSITPKRIDTVRHEITVMGKGDKERTIPISDEAWGHIAPAMYLTSDNETIITLSDSAARRAFTRLAEKAGLEGRRSSHDGRATLATGMLNNGGNLRVVQEMLGHADPATTAIYTQVTMDDMRKAATL